MGRGGGGGPGGPSGAPGRGAGFRGPGGECICPRCGHREPHYPGVPCRARVCPKCGIPLVRA
ncbi:MAG: hypothetical protein DRJ31_03260 [Candidatus Methanomethylicota archaeon]|uniref:Ferredoxin n=1 Tax=Thermoproteota archaeon TaxID=2056631 RepID=A0A497ERB6_9CREN|nr:MAG: hypothetical protein DRJ31_03260 [Candidatus Verstraetearchaeota archaeon]RLE53361.1 MAG: hypothetical protein DRJ33_01260 [Candidatus Verstraetearchaeota archaeon]